MKCKKIFFEATFSTLGYLAKSDGRVSEREIAAAQRIMAQMNLSPAMKQEAIRQFSLGKQSDFNIDQTIRHLRSACWRHPSLLKMFLDIQIQMAHADGELPAGKKAAMQTIFAQFGIAGFNFDQFEQRYHAGQHYRRQQYQQPKQSPRQHLNDAYRLLEIANNVSDADVKKAYRRLMSKNHPDKLIAQGMPPEMVKLATQKTQEIKNAYETICTARGI